MGDFVQGLAEYNTHMYIIGFIALVCIGLVVLQGLLSWVEESAERERSDWYDFSS